MIRICFVCLGNICRSPTAEAIFTDLVEKEGLSESFEIDSAGTTSAHSGESADSRARKTAKARGIQVTSRSRKIVESDFEDFDYLVAMDESNLENLRSMAPTAAVEKKVVLFRDFDSTGGKGLEVPDPYYGGSSGFDDVFDICQAAGAGLLSALRTRHKL